MATEINIKKGTEVQLTTLALAEPGFTTDTKRLYIGDGVSNILIGPTDGSGTTISGVALAVLQASSTTDIELTTTFQSIFFNVLDLSTDLTAIELDSTNISRINIKQSGPYLISYSATVRPQAATRDVVSKITANGVRDLDGSYLLQNLYENETHNQTKTFLADLTAGEYLEFNISSGSTPVSCFANQSMSVIKLTGDKGDKGDPGSGSTVIIKDEGVNVANTPHSVLNFIGDGVEVVDAGGGSIDIAITIGSSVADVFGTWYAWDGDESLTTTNSTSFIEKASLSVTAIPAGNYRIGWYYEWRADNIRYDFEARIQIDNSTTIMEQNEESKDKRSYHTESGFVIVPLTAGNHSIYIDRRVENSVCTAYMRKTRLEIWRVA